MQSTIWTKNGIKYNIVKTYPNGVRIGNVQNHKNKKKEKTQAKLGFQKSGHKKTSWLQLNM